MELYPLVNGTKIYKITALFRKSNITEISNDHIGTYILVIVNIVQIGKPFVDKYDNYETQRTLEIVIQLNLLLN